MKKELRIDISGHSATGKSTISYIIKEALEKYGFKIDLKGEEDTLSSIIGFYEQKCKRIQENGITSIVINQHQFNRDPIKKENI